MLGRIDVPFVGGSLLEVRADEKWPRDEALMGHGLLSTRPNEIDVPWDGQEARFREDVRAGVHAAHSGKFVLYWKDVFCGVSADRDRLFVGAKYYYGQSNIGVYLVPSDGKSIDEAIKQKKVGS